MLVWTRSQKKQNNNERFTSIRTADCNTLRDITVAFFKTKSGMAELYPGLKRLITGGRMKGQSIQGHKV